MGQTCITAIVLPLRRTLRLYYTTVQSASTLLIQGTHFIKALYNVMKLILKKMYTGVSLITRSSINYL